ncbi:MAG: DNA polymerase III subunit epsilon [Rhodospirillaceae bacterium]|nr:DNA polymerase III subunit epsilon [Rhodospirillaceae bacterium]MYB14081.1 DNA polymerase III subunit epsilon [Rhodospirillaceae bacterium]MYI48146.1 DNA polymerase III subunit epsilon [Rhodospirillaceae bacterium]
MREIVLDTETTGLDPAAGHRIVEIGALELQHHLPTGREYHTYLDPEREMPEEAFAIHGLSDDFLAGKAKFADAADALLDFIGDAPLVIHNAEFDLRFLNAELAQIGREPLDPGRVVDTLLIARQKFPGARASLDALCQRFEIDLAARDKHGALIDSHLLAAVYLELVGGRQPGFELAADTGRPTDAASAERERRAPRRHLPGAAPTEAERAAHREFLKKLADPIWLAE